MSELWTVGGALKWMQARFAAEQISSAKLDAELLIGAAVGLSRVQVFVEQDRPLTPEERAALRDLVKRRLAREPVAHILGRKSFLDLELTVGPGVLVPRPETEFVVDAAAELAAIGELPPGPVADLGCGAGPIGVGLSRRLERPLLAVDLSPDAVATTAANLERLATSPWLVVRGDWVGSLAGGMFAMVASNPPYVAESQRQSLAAELQHEPENALFAGPDGLDALRRLVSELPPVLQTAGWWVCEVGDGQRTTIEALLKAHGWATPRWWRDYGGVDRVFAARWGADPDLGSHSAG